MHISACFERCIHWQVTVSREKAYLTVNKGRKMLDLSFFPSDWLIKLRAHQGFADCRIATEPGANGWSGPGRSSPTDRRFQSSIRNIATLPLAILNGNTFPISLLESIRLLQQDYIDLIKLQFTRIDELKKWQKLAFTMMITLELIAVVRWLNRNV
jgi:hypothetical protein